MGRSVRMVFSLFRCCFHVLPCLTWSFVVVWNFNFAVIKMRQWKPQEKCTWHNAQSVNILFLNRLTSIGAGGRKSYAYSVMFIIISEHFSLDVRGTKCFILCKIIYSNCRSLDEHFTNCVECLPLSTTKWILKTYTSILLNIMIKFWYYEQK